LDIVLGVSTAPSMVRMVLVEGENADGVTVEEDTFEVTAGDDWATSSAAEQVVSAVVGTRESASEAGYQLLSTGVTWTDPTEAAALRDALAGREVGSAMLVSPLLAAAALAQTVGGALNYDYTALLFVEPESATLAVVDTADGSIVDLHRQLVHSADAADDLAAMVTGLESRADGVFVVGCGVDIVPIKSALESATTLAVSGSEEPDMALARGAALASANAPLFASATAALAYARDPGTGEVNPYKLAPAYIDVVANAEMGTGALAYSAIPHEEDDQSRRRAFALGGSAVAAVFVIGVVALMVSLAADVRPTVGQPPSPGGNVVIPTKQAPLPAPAAPPAPPPPAAPAPPPAAPAPPPAALPRPPAQAAPAPPPETIPEPAPVVQPRSIAPEAPVYRPPRRWAPASVPPPEEQAPAPAPPEEQAPAPAPPPAAPPPPPAAPPPAPPPPRMPPMTMYLRLPFVTVPIPINPPPPPPSEP
jgi:hypothetical protein